MKNFKFDLNAKVAIYVPSTTDVNVPTDDKESEWFGGWVSNSGALVVENVTIVYAFCTPESFGEHFEEAKQQAIERSEWVLCHGAHFAH